MGLLIVHIDAFTDKPFHGNPAAVCLMDKPADETWMQEVAREMNLSETCFLYPQQRGYNLRWFTPVAEVDLCGHATLASAHLLFQDNHLASDQTAHFYTASGELTATKSGDLIELDFPRSKIDETEPLDALVQGLAVPFTFVARTDFDWLVAIESAKQLRDLKPDFSHIAKIKERGVIVTAKSDDSSFDFISRYFAPDFGIGEDPVTGSAHCALGPYWQERLGKTSLRAYQASERGGVLMVTVRGDRVGIAGQAVTILRGELAG